MEEIKQILRHEPSPLMVGDDPRKSDKSKELAPLPAFSKFLQFISGVRLKHNACYIVAGLVISEGKVLLIQEAKPSCHGLWSVPGGRVERNESLEV